jgi:hypothetical protein
MIDYQKLLHEEQALLLRFKEILHQERECLRSISVHDLLECLPIKQTILTQLTAFAEAWPKAERRLADQALLCQPLEAVNRQLKLEIQAILAENSRYAESSLRWIGEYRAMLEIRRRGTTYSGDGRVRQQTSPGNTVRRTA